MDYKKNYKLSVFTGKRIIHEHYSKEKYEKLSDIKKGKFFLINKHLNLHSFFEKYSGINIPKNIFDYNNDYDILYNLYNIFPKNSEDYAIKKAEKQINTIKEFCSSSIDSLLNMSNKNLVDIGCGNGLLTNKISKLYNFNQPAYCIETINYLDKSVYDSIKFNITDGKKINLDNNLADLTICLLVIHHFTSMDSMIDEIIRITKPNSYLLIYEHDCISNSLRVKLDIYHIINELLLKPNLFNNYRDHYNNFANNYYSNYTTKKQLIDKLSKNFKLIKTKDIYMGFVNNYYALFQKK
jgi:ubiquinone/menaquinone biosynthesis C-methylase UbiE